MPPFFRLGFFAGLTFRTDGSDVLRRPGATGCGRRRALGCSRLRLRVLVAASDSQHPPEHGGRYGHPAGNQAEDYHCKAHHYLHCFRVF